MCLVELESIERVEMSFMQSCFWSFGRQFQSQGATAVVSLSLDGGGPATLTVKEAATPTSVPRCLAGNTSGLLIQFVRTPSASLRQLLDGPHVLLVVLLETNRVTNVQLLKLRERGR